MSTDATGGSDPLWHGALLGERFQAGDVLLVLVQRRPGLGQHSVGGGEALEERFLVELEQHLVLLHLRPFGEQHVVHEGLDPRPYLDVLRRIQLSNDLGSGAPLAATPTP
jgi:hypothetical protein